MSKHKAIEFLLEPNYYCLFSFHLLQVMTPLEAVFLMFIYNYKFRSGQTGKWFCCPMEVITREMKIDTKTQTNLVKRLSERGFLHVRMRGMPAKRYLYPDFAKVGEVIEPLLNNSVSADSPNHATQDYPNHATHIRKKNLRNNGDFPNPRVLRNSLIDDTFITKDQQFDNDCANKVKQKLKELNLFKKYNIYNCSRKWNEQFHEFRVKNKIKRKRLAKVLDWHLANLTIYSIHTPSLFCERFEEIEEKMLVECKAPITTINLDPSSEMEMKELIELIDNESWPEQAEDRTNPVLISYQNAKVFLKASNILYDERTNLQDFVRHMASFYASNPFDFTKDWFEFVHRKVDDWSDWSGSFRPFIFNFESKHFQKQLWGWAKKYSSNSEVELTTFTSRITGLMRKGQK